MRLVRWVSTVFGDSDSSVAISRLVRPSATRRRTSRSRGVSRAQLVVLGLGPGGEPALGGGIEEAASRGHGAQGGHEVLDARTLHHVPQRAGPERLAHRRSVLVHGEDADPRPRSLGPDLRQHRASVSGQGPVEQQHLRRMVPSTAASVASPSPASATSVDVRLGGEHRAHSRAHDGVIVRHDEWIIRHASERNPDAQMRAPGLGPVHRAAQAGDALPDGLRAGLIRKAASVVVELERERPAPAG